MKHPTLVFSFPGFVIGLLSPLPRQLRKLRLGYISAALAEVTCFQWILWTKKKNPCHDPYTHTHTSHIHKKIKAEKGLKLVGNIYRGARSSTEDNSLTTGRRFCGCFHDKLVKEKPPRAPWKPCNAEKELLVSSIEEKKSHGTSKLTRVDWERRRRGEEKKTDFDSAN